MEVQIPAGSKGHFWRGQGDFPIEKHCGVDAAITTVHSHLLLLILINAKYE